MDQLFIPLQILFNIFFLLALITLAWWRVDHPRRTGTPRRSWRPWHRLRGVLSRYVRWRRRPGFVGSAGYAGQATDLLTRAEAAEDRFDRTAPPESHPVRDGRGESTPDDRPEPKAVADLRARIEHYRRTHAGQPGRAE
jgi:hypothetical protein